MPDFYGSTAEDPTNTKAQIKSVQKLSGRLNSMIGTIALASAVAQNDRVLLGTIASNAVLSSLGKVDFDAFGTGATLELGGDVNALAGSDNNLIAAGSIASAGSLSAMAAIAIQNREKYLWEQLGYTEDPGGTLEIWATLTGANPAAGDLAWEIIYAER